MPDDRKRIREEVEELVNTGEDLHFGGLVRELPDDKREATKKRIEKEWKGSPRGKAAKKSLGKDAVSPIVKASEAHFGSQYQRWYSQALRIVEQLLSDRYVEFRELYRLDKVPKELDVTTYTVSDYIAGTSVSRGGVRRFDPASVGLGKFENQLDILASALTRLDSLLSDIEGTLESALLDDELETAGELLRAKHLRSAGIVAGVVLERHMKSVMGSHQLSLGRKKSQIGNLNDALKEGKVIDVPRWREIQRLGDIRNLCGHDGDREPTRDEVAELISGTEKVIAQVF